MLFLHVIRETPGARSASLWGRASSKASPRTARFPREHPGVSTPRGRQPRPGPTLERAPGHPPAAAQSPRAASKGRFVWGGASSNASRGVSTPGARSLDRGATYSTHAIGSPTFPLDTSPRKGEMTSTGPKVIYCTSINTAPRKAMTDIWAQGHGVPGGSGGATSSAPLMPRGARMHNINCIPLGLTSHTQCDVLIGNAWQATSPHRV